MRLWAGIVVHTLILSGLVLFTSDMIFTRGMPWFAAFILIVFMIVWGGLFCGLSIWDNLCQLRGVRRPFKPPYRSKFQPAKLPELYKTAPPYALQPHGAALSTGTILGHIVAFIFGSLMVIFLIDVFVGSVDQRLAAAFCTLLFGIAFFATGLTVVQSMLKRRFAKKTKISISAPAVQGGSFEVRVSHPELQKIKRMAVDLVMEEVAHISDGDNSSIDKKYVITVPICHLFSKDIRRFERLVARNVIELPASTVATFQSKHNEINWFFLVRVDLDLWEGLEQRFPLHVVPAELVSREVYEQEERVWAT